MINARIDRAVWILLLVLVGLYLSLPLLSFLGCKEKAEAYEPTQFEERIHWDEDVGGFITIDDCTFTIPEPNEPEFKIEIKGDCWSDCGHDRLKSTHEYWALTTTMDDKRVLFHGEYRCLDCGSNITIANAISTKGKK